MSLILKALLFIGVCVSIVLCASKNKPHGHQGALDHYNGKPIPFKITAEQEKKLSSGEPVTYNDRGAGKSGKGVVIQDVNASVAICMGRIRDLGMYSKMVPHVKKVEIYDNVKFANGTSKIGAQFNIGLMGLKFTYFLKLTHEPKYSTLTWTLDYTKNSDFDDNVGHWQVMPHPTKSGWTRVLYSTKVKLFPWIPNFVVTFITTKALVESTTWVKKEAEIEAAKSSGKPEDPLKKLLPSWMISGGSTNNSVAEKDVVEGDAREGKRKVQKEGPHLGRQQTEVPQAKQHNFNGLLHPFFRLRSSLGGKAI